jgi:hypothetical protein
LIGGTCVSGSEKEINQVDSGEAVPGFKEAIITLGPMMRNRIN